MSNQPKCNLPRRLSRLSGLGLFVAGLFLLSAHAPAGAEPAPAKEKSQPAAKTVKQNAVVQPPPRMMVPPPPPDMHLVPGGHLLSSIGVTLDYMSRRELETMLQRLQASETKLQKQIGERDQILKDKKDRAEQFEQLFKEGVVSRKELENARRDLSELDVKNIDVDNALKDVESDLALVKNQLDVVQKREVSKPASKTGKTTKASKATKDAGKEKVNAKPEVKSN